ncbi:MAG TPA: hypothetical protein VG963_14750, partial [Polyangiaceae bacterium]|nr:hypothetical protein [Polyangiaceae bacterium]
MGGTLGVASLKPKHALELPRLNFAPARFIDAMTAAPRAPLAHAVALPKVPVVPKLAAAAPVPPAPAHEAAKKPEQPAPIAAISAPAPTPSVPADAPVAQDEHPGGLEEDDPPHWDPSASEQWALAARSTAPGQTWQEAANIGDWVNVAQLIDALPAAERAEPGARYARAVAARELGQCEVALAALEDLEASLPLLHDEIQSARALCQLEVGPFDAAYEYFTREQSAENLILAARAGPPDAKRLDWIFARFEALKRFWTLPAGHLS